MHRTAPDVKVGGYPQQRLSLVEAVAAGDGKRLSRLPISFTKFSDREIDNIAQTNLSIRNMPLYS